MALKRALTFKNILDAKIQVFDFTDEWYDAFGTPERCGIWYIYGASGHGKTSFILMLMKELAKFEKILFLSYEEGEKSEALKRGIKRLGLTDINNKVLVSTESITDMELRMEKRNSPNIIIIDSLNVSGIRDINKVVQLKKKFPNKTFIYIGWARGQSPIGNLGEAVLFAANQKIFIEGYRAFSRGRSFGTKKYIDIWREEAELYHEFK